MIKPCWGYLKRITTKRGPLTSRAAAEKAWLGAWQDLKQWRIQQWIERIPRHIEKVIELKGGNNYREGADEKQQSRKQLREEANRKLSTIVEVLKTGYEILRNYCGLPDAYLQFFLPTQSRKEIKEITEEEWQKSADLVVPNRRQNTQGSGLIADRQLYNQGLQRNNRNQVVERVESQAESQGQQKQLRPRKPRKPVEYKVRWNEVNQVNARH
jgi:hypothetical protein